MRCRILLNFHLSFALVYRYLHNTPQLQRTASVSHLKMRVAESERREPDAFVARATAEPERLGDKHLLLVHATGAALNCALSLRVRGRLARPLHVLSNNQQHTFKSVWSVSEQLHRLINTNKYTEC